MPSVTARPFARWLGLLLGGCVVLAAPGRDALDLTGYLAEYHRDRVGDVRFDLLDHVILFSAEAEADGGLRLSPPLQELVRAAKTKATKPGQLSLAVGGWGRSEGFGRFAVKPGARAHFVGELVALCRREGFGGADLDWEFPRTAAEQEGFDALLEELHAAFAPAGLRLTSAVGVSQTLSARAVAALDRIHLMTYDMGRPNHAPYAGVAAEVERRLNAGVPPAKLALGVPFYGRGTNDSRRYISYRDLLARNAGPAEDADEAEGYGFNGPATLRTKVALARKRRLAGVMIWELGEDAVGERSLLRVLHQDSQR